MASGQKYNNDVKEKAYAYFDTYNNMEFISRKLGVPVSTLWGWKRKYDKMTEEDPALAAARAQYKKEFVRSAWHSIRMAQEVMERRLRRAVENEDLIDELMSLVEQEAREEKVSEKRRLGLVAKVSALHCDDLGKLSATLGMLYDKQALANREATEIVDGELAFKRFEEL